MDIGTGKVARADRERLPHFGLDLVDPDEPFGVADFVRHALETLAACSSAGRPVILVGGTGLYLRAVGRGLPIGETGHDPAIRERLEARLAEEGIHELVAELKDGAPLLASRTDMTNPRRVVRALERALVVGDQPPAAPTGYDGSIAWIGLSVEPGAHRAAIGERVGHQFASGLLEEASTLRARFGDAPRAFSAVGYREAFDVLDGHRSVDDAIEATAQRTWAYARRQRTWFRSEPGITWLDPADPATSARAIREMRRLIADPR